MYYNSQGVGSFSCRFSPLLLGFPLSYWVLMLGAWACFERVGGSGLEAVANGVSGLLLYLTQDASADLDPCQTHVRPNRGILFIYFLDVCT